MKKTISVLLIVFLFLFASCEETSGRGNLRIVLDTSSQTKTLKPDDRSSTVVKYNVSGTGPGGKTFSKDSSSKTITVEGLVMGHWTVYATGYNSDSSAILSGSKSFDFDTITKSVSLALSPSAGVGSLQVNYSWEKELTNPVLTGHLQGPGTSIDWTYSPEDNSNNYKYIKNNLPSGYYTLTSKLFNGEKLITGSVETVQIIGNKTTSGEVNLDSPSGTSQDSSTLSVNDNSGMSFTGHFSIDGYSNLPYAISAQTAHTVKISFGSDYTLTDSFEIKWFLDGQEIPKTNEDKSSVTITPSIGNHILNVVVTNKKTEVSSSMFYKFKAKTNAKKGSAILLETLGEDNEEKILLASDSMLGALPDNQFVIITPSRSSMQVFSVYNGSVMITDNRTYNAADLRFMWIPQATAVYSSADMNFFAVREGTGIIHILYYNQTSGKIDVANWNEEPLIISGFYKMPPAYIDKITSVTLIPSSDFGGLFFLCDSGPRSQEILHIETSGKDVTNMGTTTKSDNMKNIVCSDGVSDTIAIVDASDTISFAKIKNGVISSAWSTHSDNFLTKINDIKFLNSNFAVISATSNLRIYEYYSQQRIWVARTAIDTAPSDFDLSSDSAYIYIADTNKNLTTYKSGLTDNFGKIHSQETNENLTKIVASERNIVGLDNHGNLYIFDIAQEDSSL